MTERIIAAALNLGLVAISAPPPARHHTLLHAFIDMYPMTRFGSDTQGFLTSTGRYVSREEALQIALAAGQTDAPKFQPTQLFSEDLW